MVRSERGASFGPLSSLRVLWTRNGTSQIYGTYDRPPFPIVIDTPTVGDVLRELRFSDVFMLGSIYAAGICMGYASSRPFPMLMQRLVVYHGISHVSLLVGMSLAFQLPYRRLTGYHDNGLRWSAPEDRLKKFDATSLFEQATVWGRFRTRPDEQ